MPFVLDASVALAWCFEDERGRFTDGILERLREDTAVAPSLWTLEVANALLVAERRGRLTRSDVTRYSDLLLSLPIDVDEAGPTRIFGVSIDIARAHALSVYDAAYLELAMRAGLPLATQDRKLLAAAGSLGVPAVQRA